MTAPSNANTSGLVEKLVERARVSTDPLLAMYAVEASKALVTAACAQAEINAINACAQEEADALASKLTAAEIVSASWKDRATAAEARADRLVKALERIAHEKGVSNVAIARAALQQEG